MFERYKTSIRRRIYSLLSSVIDTNVKLGIHDPKTITSNFIKEIQSKELDTWISLREYIDSTYFYNECIKYIELKIDGYIDRFKGETDKGVISQEQVDYLSTLISKSLKSKDYKIRSNGIKELKSIINLLSKVSASQYIDNYKDILGWNKKKENEITEDNKK